jgi:hypothetical protein
MTADRRLGWQVARHRRRFEFPAPTGGGEANAGRERIAQRADNRFLIFCERCVKMPRSTLPFTRRNPC